jgi:MFS superfamily sulfate permease-like transporter
MKEPQYRAMHRIEKVIPGIEMARSYQRRWLRADPIVGITFFTKPVP